MPFAINAATEYINPTKALEYFATGRPVISTPVKDVVRQYSGLVDIVKTPEQFVAAAERLLKEPPTQRIEKCLELAKGCSWESTVANMQRLIKEAITNPDRRSSQKVVPLTEAELEYQYAPTPGS